MSRLLTWAFVIGLALLVVGLLISVSAPASPVGVVLVIVAALVLLAIAFAVSGMARRTKGWYLRTPRGKGR